ncbi:VanZ family protein [Mariniblastus sp.]|nr:VanZ family protein [Mariniblastus sp.]
MLNFRLLIRVVTVIYALAIAGIVWCASAGWYRPTFGLVQSYVSDKWLHFMLVGVLTLLLNLSLNLAAVSHRTKWLLWGTSLMLVLATLEEASQFWISNRTLDVSDLACNYLGILIIGHLPWLIPRSAGLNTEH